MWNQNQRVTSLVSFDNKRDAVSNLDFRKC